MTVPVSSATRWALALAFLGGLAGGDATSVVFAGVGAFTQGTVTPRAPGNAAILVIAGWAAGMAVGALLTVAGAGRALAPPSQLGAGLSILAAYASAFAASALTWVASRLERQS